MNRIPIIGLTGGIGSGKSTVAKVFLEHHGIPSIDADDVARQIVQLGEPCLVQIKEHFGQGVLHSSGELNRAALREIVFNDKNALSELEAITHPAIKEKLASQLDNMHGEYGLLVHPLLFEKSQHELCDFTVAISVPVEVQIARVMNRDSNTKEQALRIIKTQLSDQERCSRADFILENTGQHSDLNVKVSELHNKIKSLLKYT